MSALPLLFLHSTPTLPVLCLFSGIPLLASLPAGQFWEDRTFTCVFPTTLQSPDKHRMQEAPRNRNVSHPGAPHCISQALLPRVPGWWGRPRRVLREACLNSSSSACKLSLYLIPPTVISSPSLLPSAGVTETRLRGGHAGRQLRVNLGSLHA